MAIALVQSTETTSSTTLAYGSNNTAGNFLLCMRATGAYSTVPTDTLSNTWVEVVNGGNNWTIYYAANCAGGANTVTAGGTSQYFTLYEFSGVKTTSPLDVSGQGSEGITTTKNGDLVFYTMDDHGGTITGFTPWTGGQSMNLTGTPQGTTQQDGWIVQATAGAIYPDWTGSGTFPWNGAIGAAFFAAPVAAAVGGGRMPVFFTGSKSG